MCVFLPVNISLFITYYCAMVLHQYSDCVHIVLPVSLLQGEVQHYDQTVLSGPWSFIVTQLEPRVLSQQTGPV